MVQTKIHPMVARFPPPYVSFKLFSFLIWTDWYQICRQFPGRITSKVMSIINMILDVRFLLLRRFLDLMINSLPAPGKSSRAKVRWNEGEQLPILPCNTKGTLSNLREIVLWHSSLELYLNDPLKWKKPTGSHHSHSLIREEEKKIKKKKKRIFHL